MDRDAIDHIWEDTVVNLKTIEDYLSDFNLPESHKNSQGANLVGHPKKEIMKLLIFQQLFINRMEYDMVLSISKGLTQSLDIQDFATYYLYSLNPKFNNVPFLKDLSLRQTILKLYEEYSGLSEKELLYNIKNKQRTYDTLWKETIKDEHSIEPEQLYQFYNSIPFPCNCTMSSLIGNDYTLSMAYSGLPIALAKDNKSTRFFDYGGGSGLLASSASVVLNIHCTLFEISRPLLDFAKWRDNLYGIGQVSYYDVSEYSSYESDLKGKYDFGVCTEVMQHVIDAEKLAQRLSDLLCSGGLLFFSSSLSVIQPSNLPHHRRIIGQEVEIMRNAGLEPADDITSPLILLNNMRIYRKK